MLVGNDNRVAGVVGVALLVAAALGGCSGGGSRGGGSLGAGSTAPLGSSPTTTSPVTTATPAPVGTQVVARGTFKALTYNVAGLPQGISASQPVANHPQISPLLNAYDLVLVQEDFAYHNLLKASATHPIQTPELTGYSTFMGDGLNAFSKIPLANLARTKWIDCNGWINQSNDCLASKGFFFSTIEPQPGLVIHLYDLHADAGRSGADINARKSQFRQLADAILALSKGHAVIVTGDTNLKTPKEPLDEQILVDFLRVTGLKDAARTLQAPETIDRFMFRNSANGEVELEAKKWRYADEMIDKAGLPLSDHEGVNVDFEWRLVK